ncbi:MAG: hypothetical protein JXJ04_09620 [Spirochaetales bacterium]|nr:hypothetical protein [Spirochaetales bacterium]
MKRNLMCLVVLIILIFGFLGCPEPVGDPGTITVTLTDAAAEDGGTFYVIVYDSPPAIQTPVGINFDSIDSGTCELVVEGYAAGIGQPDGNVKEFDGGTYYIVVEVGGLINNYQLPNGYIKIDLDGNYATSISLGEMELQ